MSSQGSCTTVPILEQSTDYFLLVSIQLDGSFVKNNTTYSFWAFFPDGVLTGKLRGKLLVNLQLPEITVSGALMSLILVLVQVQKGFLYHPTGPK